VPVQDAPSIGLVNRARLAGALAAAAALAAGELVTALDAEGPSLITAIGDEFIDRFAATLKDLAVALFGTNDKVALVVGIVVVAMALGAGLGRAALRRPWVARAGFGVAGALGAASYLASPTGTPAVGLAAAAIAIAVGLGTLGLLLGVARAADPTPTTGAPDAGGVDAGGASGPPSAPRATAARASADADASRMGRRRFLVTAAAIAGGAAVAGVLGRSLRSTEVVESARRSITIPRPGRVTAVPATTGIDVPGVTPYVIANDDFYRIDTALRVPVIDVDGWQLEISGMVERPFTITFDELLALESVEEPVTLQCVSNEVGGRLVGNAVWQGVPLAALLERAGVQAGATQIVGRSVDDFTAGFPTEVGLDGRTALVAYAMNGEPLPADHGFPARLVVSGLYGYVSATKWLRSIELTTWEDFDGYWVPRGWSKEGPIKLASRIDVPNRGPIPAGPTAVAGIALAPSIGVAAVEVQVDDGPWEPATLGDVASEHTWVQWRFTWDATPGEHTLRVRAIDANGLVQTGERTRPAPNGATGWHERRITVA
jgi:DMSO/TMAO reductase YedYZ molybdopterin-dependent catalytic subunit